MSKNDARVIIIPKPRRQVSWPCLGNPCGEHGYCVPINTQSFICECESGWLQDQMLPGPNCMLTVSFECDPVNCKNGGRCPFGQSGISESFQARIQRQNASYVPPVVSCICPKAFRGHFCEIVNGIGDFHASKE
ncbi:uncharacterized protein LOC142351928 [Convolutriloba macropyga]|uniref:uncharacterized protein LOC142351928 n=1 Tax=Convolutriloba macropyga TaxID=536237 RepID=UPI003F51DAFE